MVTFNQLLLLGGVAVGGYLIWTNQGAITSFVQSLTNPAPAATASGSSSVNLTGVPSPTTMTTGTGASTTGCANGSIPDPTTGLCSDGSIPSGQTVGTGVNNSLQLGQTPTGVVPTVSGGADIGGAGVNSDNGPTFTDPITGQTYNPATGQILSPGGSTQVPNFSPFVEPQVGNANLGPGVGGSLSKPCVQTQACMLGYTWDPILCQCVQPGGVGLQTGNPLCPNGQTPNADGSCPTSTTPTTTTTTSPNPTTTTTTPAQTAGTPTPTCPAGTFWNPVIQQCNYPVVAPTAATSTAPTTTTTSTPTSATIQPPTSTPTSTVTTTPIAAPTSTTTAAAASTNCKCCAASPHNGNCHSECCWKGCMTSSKCLSCLQCCGDYEGNSCKTSSVGYAYQGRALMHYANEGMMIAAAAAVTPTALRARASGKRYPTIKHGARVSSRSQKLAPNAFSQLTNRAPMVTNIPNRVAVS